MFDEFVTNYWRGVTDVASATVLKHVPMRWVGGAKFQQDAMGVPQVRFKLSVLFGYYYLLVSSNDNHK